MPSRPIAVGIILLWLATLGWVVQREVLPRFRAGEPPPFYLDLVDEVAGRTILWEVFDGEEKIGVGQTRVVPKKDRTFDLSYEMIFLKFEMSLGARLTKVSGFQRVNELGELLAFSATMKLDAGGINLQARFSGEIRDKVLYQKLALAGFPEFEKFFPKPEPLELEERCSLFNVLQPQHKITGLHEGRTWLISMFNPAEAYLSLKKKMEFKRVLAAVASEELDWTDGSVACWRIDIGEPGKLTETRIWVRKSDSVVLQHEASFGAKKLFLKRAADK